jgi:ectoine hydroxylase-related dioxygenase (phytanoyl-CoA dioxygenase family)
MPVISKKLLDEFDANGVIVMRDIVEPDVLGGVVKEYDATVPTLVDMEIPKHVPIVVFWTHVVGGRKKLKLLTDMPQMAAFTKKIASIVKEMVGQKDLRLLETIIFNKPPKDSNVLRWHQDVSYFPFEPNNQIAVWLPFDVVTRASGALLYAVGTHKMDLRASTDLHSGAVFKNEDRRPIPDDPEAEGIPVVCMETKPGDMIIHDGRTWHMSGRNTVQNRERRGLSLRFLIGDTYYQPRAGSAAAFIKQIDIMPGQRIDDPAFPVLA